MSNSTLLIENNLDRLRDAISVGFEKAASGLSEMVGRKIEVISPSLRIIAIEEMPNLLGQADEAVVAAYVRISGDITGHIMLIVSLDTADELVEMLVGPRAQRASTLDAMEQSALGEVANITGSFFLSALSDATSLFMQPSPPALIMDMIGAALDVPLAELALSAHDALIIDTLFISDESRIKGIFLVLPDTGSTRLFVERLSGQDG